MPRRLGHITTAEGSTGLAPESRPNRVGLTPAYTGFIPGWRAPEPSFPHRPGGCCERHTQVTPVATRHRASPPPESSSTCSTPSSPCAGTGVNRRDSLKSRTPQAAADASSLRRDVTSPHETSSIPAEEPTSRPYASGTYGLTASLSNCETVWHPIRMPPQHRCAPPVRHVTPSGPGISRQTKCCNQPLQLTCHNKHYKFSMLNMNDHD